MVLSPHIITPLGSHDKALNIGTDDVHMYGFIESDKSLKCTATRCYLVVVMVGAGGGGGGGGQVPLLWSKFSFVIYIHIDILIKATRSRGKRITTAEPPNGFSWTGLYIHNYCRESFK